VKRRVVSSVLTLPRDLAVYTPGPQWPGRDPGERYGAWMHARMFWCNEHDLLGLPDDDAAREAWPETLFYHEDI